MKKLILVVFSLLLLTGCGLIDIIMPTSEQPTEPSSVQPNPIQAEEPIPVQP